MASIRQLKSRIRSVKSTKQITKAMEMVAASKMRRAQEATKSSEAYTLAANQLLTYFANQQETDNHPLFIKRVVKRRMIIVISSDRGLAGAYDSNVLKRFLDEVRQDDLVSQTVTVGSKAAKFIARIKETDITGVYQHLDDRPPARELRAIVDSAITAFEEGTVDAVDVIYTKFHNAINQKVTRQRILPAGFEATDVPENIQSALYEPDTETVLDTVVYRLIEAQVFQALLDAKASEYSMRMVAMKSATDNANDLIDDLTVEMNKERQANITQELAEISGGVEAMKD